MTIWHHSNICISCGLCTSVCPTRAIKLTPDNKIVIDRSGCNNSGECVKICPSQALQFTGSVVTDSQVLSEILKDKIFYESSSGGITLTGGEPLFQVDFSATILKSCKENGIHTAIETCLYTDTENIQKILEYTDLFITDLKIYNEELHRKYTGRSNEIILQNFRFIAESGRDIIVRTPVIPGITDSAENKEAIRDFVRKTRFDIPVEYINFNPLTRNNYDKLGIPYLI